MSVVIDYVSLYLFFAARLLTYFPMINGTILQCFHWYSPGSASEIVSEMSLEQAVSLQGKRGDRTLWQQIGQDARRLAQAGFSALWLPPMTKGSRGVADVGYSAYDLYDLGEFDQCGSVATKYGDRTQLLTAITQAQAAGLQVYGDVVLHRKHGGDGIEQLEGTPVVWHEPNRAIAPSQAIMAHSQFTFPGRGHRYSAMTWHGKHFQRVNHKGSNTLYRLKNKTFGPNVDVRLGRSEPTRHPPDASWACELDLDMPEVVQALDDWGDWFLKATGLNGFRIEGAKHIPATFIRDWLQRLQAKQLASSSATSRSGSLPSPTQSLFVMGDYWSNRVNDLHWYIAKSEGQLSLFDVPLHYNFHFASRQGCYYDLRNLLKGTLMQDQPALAVTFVENHNSQPLQLLESPVEAWFKPLAYAFILLRREGYPCVFAADYYGAHYFEDTVEDAPDSRQREVQLPSHQWILNRLLFARSHHAYGEQYDYFEQPNLIGWTRLGNAEHPQAMAVVMSNDRGGQQWMEVGKAHAQFIDITQHLSQPVWTNGDGWGPFACQGNSVSVWIEVS